MIVISCGGQHDRATQGHMDRGQRQGALLRAHRQGEIRRPANGDKCGAQFQVIPTIDGDLDLEAAEKMISENVKFFATTAVSNVLGTVVDIRKLIGLAKKYEIPVFIDAAQALRHESFDLCSFTRSQSF